MAFNDRITLAMRNEVKEASKSLFGNFAQGYEKLFYSYLLRTIEYWEQSIEDGKKQIVKYNKYSKSTDLQKRTQKALEKGIEKSKSEFVRHLEIFKTCYPDSGNYSDIESILK